MGKFLEPIGKVVLDKRQIGKKGKYPSPYLPQNEGVQAYIQHHVFPNKYNPHMGKKQLEKAARRANAVL